MSSSKTVLVTGASGFVGRALVHRLHARGFAVLGTTTQATPANDADVEWIRWDAQDALVPDVDWAAVDVVVHLANPRTAMAASNTSLRRVAVSATGALLERAQAHGAHFIFSSSGDALGPRHQPIAETDVDYQPVSAYGAAKAEGERLVRAAARSAVLRLFHPYGPGGDAFLVNRLVRRVQTRQEISLEGRDGILVNPTWIDDLCAAFEACITRGGSGVYNIAGPTTMSLRAILEIAGQLLGVTPILRVEPTVPACRVALMELARRELHYLPTITLEQGLRRLIDGMRAGATDPTSHQQ